MGWRVLYSIVSIVGFVLLIRGYGLARQQPLILYQPQPWMRHFAALLMLPVFPLLFAAYMPGRIRTAMKHPMLVAVKLWAVAHLLANGALADVVLFGAFLAWAVADRVSFKHRTQRPIPSAPSSRWNDLLAIVLGLAVYVLFVGYLHAKWIGVPVMP